MNRKLYVPRPVEIIDTTLRDGLQSPRLLELGKVDLTTEENVTVAQSLIRYGVRYIEMFSPIVDPKYGEDVRAVIEARNRLEKEEGISAFILAHVRCDIKDVDEALRAGVDGLNFYMGTSEQSQQNNHGKNIDQIIERATDIIRAVRRDVPDLLIRFSGEDAFRTEFKVLEKVYKELAPYVDRFGTPDTVGVAEPSDVSRRVKQLKKAFPNVELEGHFHNDEENAIPNAVAAVTAGMRFIQTTVNGYAERNGITNLSSLMYKLDKLERTQGKKYLVDYDLGSTYALNVLHAQIINDQVPPGIVSSDNRTHSAGVHTGAMIKSMKNNDGKGNVYEGRDLERFGVADSKLLPGPLSGWTIIAYYLTKFLDYKDVSDDKARSIAKEFKSRCRTLLKGGMSATQALDLIAKEHGLVRDDKKVALKNAGTIHQNEMIMGEPRAIAHEKGVK